MPRDKNQDENHVRCEACDFQKLKRMENHPTVRELRDKIEQLNFRLTECKTENQALKRNLQIAKQMIYKEVGEDSLKVQDIKKQGADFGKKQRTEMIISLKGKVEELQLYLNQLEGKPSMSKVPVSEECNREQLAADRKVFWRLELERRKARENADKELDPLLKESTELRKKLEAERLRFKEFTNEVNLLKVKLQNQVDKNEQDMGLTKSFQNIENQLQEVQSERAEIRTEILGSKARNKRLEEEIAGLQGELQALTNKSKNNNMLIDSYTNKHKQIQEAVEKEKIIFEEHKKLHNLELEELKSNHALDSNTLISLQDFCQERHHILSQLENDIQSGLLATIEISPMKKKKAENRISKDTLEDEQLEINDEKEENLDSASVNKAWLKKKIKLLFEYVKYKSLLKAAENERTQLHQIISVQETRMNDFAVKVIENERLIAQNEIEKKALEEKISSLHKTLAKKKVYSVEPINELKELQIKIESQKQENTTIRNFLYNLILTRTRDLVFYKTLFQDNKDHFLYTLQDSFKSLKEMIDSSSAGNDSVN